jgi:hypothetical protein
VTDGSDSGAGTSGGETKPAQPAASSTTGASTGAPGQGQGGGTGDAGIQMVTPIEWPPSVLREATPAPRRSPEVEKRG